MTRYLYHFRTSAGLFYGEGAESTEAAKNAGVHPDDIIRFMSVCVVESPNEIAARVQRIVKATARLKAYHKEQKAEAKLKNKTKRRKRA